MPTNAIESIYHPITETFTGFPPLTDVRRHYRNGLVITVIAGITDNADKDMIIYKCRR